MAHCSIIMPVYNGEKYLIEALDSIKKQIGLHDELIVVNDGSSDGTRNLLDQYELAQLKVIHKENEGVSVARNVGLKAATKEYIVFVDSDDILNDGVLHYLHHTDLKECDMIIGKTMIHLDNETKEEKVIENLNSFKLSTREETIADFISANDNLGIWAVWRHVFRREFLIQEEILFNKDYSYAEDMDFILEALQKAKSFGLIKMPLVKYRIYKDSVSGNYSLKSMMSQIDVLNKWQKIYSESNFEIFNRNRIVRFFANKQLAMLAHTKHLSKDEQKMLFDYYEEHATYLRKSSGKFKLVYQVGNAMGYDLASKIITMKSKS